MKILHAMRSIDPALGGPIESVKQLASVLLRMGHRPEVVSLDGPSDPFLKNFPLPVYPLGPAKSFYGRSEGYVPWLREHARDYDIVVVEGIWQFQSFGVWQALRGTSTPYAVFTHGMLDPWFKRTYPLKHLKKWLYWPWAEYRVLRDADAVLFTCEEERLLARQSFWLYKAKEKIVNLGTSSPAGDPNVQKQILLAAHPELNGKRLALFISRIHPKKGCDLAIRGFAQTLAADPAWHLVMAGPDQVGWRTELEKIASSLNISHRITWTGMITGDLKWGALRAAEVMLLPSHQENFGIVVAEALACGTPVLISNKVNIWREVEQDGAGFVAEDNVAGTASILQRWTAQSEEQRLQMQTAARACFENRFEIHKAAESLVSVLSGLLKKPVAAPVLA